MTGEPVENGRCLVRAVVIHHQVNIQIAWHGCFDGAQEFQELAAAMPSMQLPNDFASGDVECGKQGG